MNTEVNTISLVSTTHRENGLANSGNLYSILQHINPEVIFIELPPDHYDHYFTTCSRKMLESDSINMYQKHNLVEIIPVDSKAPDSSLRDEIDFLFNRIDSNSDCLESILGYINQFTCQYGFPYLNSKKYREHLTAQKEEELNTVKKINDPKLIKLYDLWGSIHEQRENEMLHNIQEYSAKHSFSRAVLLVGSAHSHSILKKVNDDSSQFGIELFSYSKDDRVASNGA